MANVLVIANWFIHRARQEDRLLTKIKLQKLLYFSFGNYYVKNKSYLFEDDFEAWQYGPVIRLVYDATKNVQGYYLSQEIEGERVGGICEKELEILEATWNYYSKRPDFDLVEETHKDGTPWHRANIGGEKNLKKEDIVKYFCITESILQKHYNVFKELAKE